MQLIEMKSLREVSLLFELSDNLHSFYFKRWVIELDLLIVRKTKVLCDLFNEFHIKYPYGLM